MSTDLPPNEELRIAALKEYAILDTAPERPYDEITKLAATICNAPIAAISLLDAHRVWNKSVFGIDFNELRREDTFCTHAVLTPNEVFEVPDTLLDERFKNNPQITGGAKVRSFTAIPLINPEGFALGTLCVIDNVPHKLTDVQIESLKTLAHQVLYLMKLKKRNMQLEKLQTELEHKNKELQQFAYVVAHDIKNPIASLLLTSEILEKNYTGKLDDNGAKFLGYLTRASGKVNDLVNGILEYYSSNTFEDKAEVIDFLPMVAALIEMLHIKEDVEIILPEEKITVIGNRVALEQIFLNLVNNAVKYNDKENIRIEIGFAQCDNFYRFTIKDNGCGIAAENHEKIFDLFTRLNNKDRYNKHGTGIGLATVKKVVEALGGEIGLTSTTGVGTEFFFTIKKQLPIINISSAEMLTKLSAQA